MRTTSQASIEWLPLRRARFIRESLPVCDVSLYGAAAYANDTHWAPSFEVVVSHSTWEPNSIQPSELHAMLKCGLVRYVTADTWELTPEGIALLRR